MASMIFSPAGTQLDNDEIADIVIDGIEKKDLLDGTNFTFV